MRTDNFVKNDLLRERIKHDDLLFLPHYPSSTHMRFLPGVLTLSCIYLSGYAQNFTDMTPADFASSPYSGITKWADLDNDGKLELVYSGVGGYATRVTKIMYLQGGAFNVNSTTDYGGGTQVHFDNLDFGDYDGDGDLDIVVLGEPYPPYAFTVLRNEGNLNFVKTFDLPPSNGTAYWRDTDNDGSLDILYTTGDAGIYFNRQGKFDNQMSLNTGYRFVTYQSAADVDSDGDLDIIQARWSAAFSGTFDGNYLFTRNADGTYTETRITAMPSAIHQAEFTDNDGDGDLDVLIRTAANENVIYKFQSGTFVNTNISLPVANNSKWADFNNDGYEDIIFTGIETTFMNFVTRIYYSNAGASFTDSGITELPGFNRSTVSVGDFDRDGDPDVALAGDNMGAIYRNNWVENSNATNAPPGIPLPTATTVVFNRATLQWNDGTDDKTPANSLSYDLEVKRSDGTVIKPGSYISSAVRTLYRQGNVDLTNTYTIGCLQEGSYSWKVQAVDNSFQGSPFASGSDFNISNIKPVTPANVKATAISDRRIVLTWSDVSTTETSYVIERKFKNDPYPTFFMQAELAANSTSFTDTIVSPSTEYVYRITAKNCSYPNEYVTEIEGKALPPLFENAVIASLPAGAYAGTAALGDYDNDRDLDLCLEYFVNSSLVRTVLKFQNGQFEATGIQFTGTDPLTGVQWIDLNKDGYLDLVMTMTNRFDFKIEVYLNTRTGQFTKSDAFGFAGMGTIRARGPAFADFDADGDLDALVQGLTTTRESAMRIYVNDGANHFSDSGIVLDAAALAVQSSKPWGDFDNDGYPDLLVSRLINCIPKMRILKNMGGKSFTEVDIGANDGVTAGNDFYRNTEWIDYDNDGYLDFVIAGPNYCNVASAVTKVFRNNRNGTFSPLAATLRSMDSDANLETVDFNNDGYADIFVSGSSSLDATIRNRLYFYDNGSYSNSKFQYISSGTGDLLVGDIDNDMDVDYIRLGYPAAAKVFKNNYSNIWGAANHVPQAPTNLQSVVSGNAITLSWSRPIDAETPSAGLTYNIYLTNGTDSVIVPNSHWNGYRKIVEMGNVQHATSIMINRLPPGTYSWGVQAIDKSFAGGPFSAKQSVVVATSLPPVTPPVTPPGTGTVTTAIEPTQESFRFFPNPVRGADLYIEVNRPTEIRVFDITGHPVFSETVDHDQTIPTTQWAPGVYILKYTNADETRAVKIVRN
jgi:hypothetical protein